MDVENVDKHRDYDSSGGLQDRYDVNETGTNMLDNNLTALDVGASADFQSGLSVGKKLINYDS